jgi:flagellar biosynthesis/type III secretory pathway protein FliH
MSRILKSHFVNDKERWLPLPFSGDDAQSMSETTAAPDPAEVVLQAAREEAAALLASARQESEVLCKQAYAEGLAQGLAEGEAIYQEKLAYLQSLVHEVNTGHEAYLSQAEGELVRLAMGIAEKVLFRQIEDVPEVIIDMARAHLRRIRERETIAIRVHPLDLPALVRGRDALLQSVDGLQELSLTGDGRLERGDMMLEAESGALDARIATQLAVIERALDEAEDSTDEPPLV